MYKFLQVGMCFFDCKTVEWDLPISTAHVPDHFRNVSIAIVQGYIPYFVALGKSSNLRSTHRY